METFFIFFTTFFIQLIIAVEMNLVAPLAPYISEYFKIKPSSVVFFNIGFSIVGLLVPILGAFADKYGKKRSIILSLLFFIIGTIISGLAKIPILFAIGRVFIGIGYFALSGINFSYISEFIPYESRGKASGLLRLAFGIAILGSPIYATTLIAKYNNLLSIYLPLTIIGIISLIFMTMLPETEKNNEIKLEIRELISLIKKPINFKALLIAFLFLATPLFLMNFLGIYLSSHFKLNQLKIGYVYTIVAFGTMFGVIFAGLFIDKIGKEKLAKISYSLVFVSLIILLISNSLNLIIVSLILMALGLDSGWTAYQTLLSEIEPNKKGIFMSLLYTINAIAVTVFSILGPIFYNIGGYYLLIILAIATNFIGLIIFYNTPFEKKASSKL